MLRDCRNWYALWRVVPRLTPHPTHRCFVEQKVSVQCGFGRRGAPDGRSRRKNAFRALQQAAPPLAASARPRYALALPFLHTRGRLHFWRRVHRRRVAWAPRVARTTSLRFWFQGLHDGHDGLQNRRQIATAAAGLRRGTHHPRRNHRRPPQHLRLQVDGVLNPTDALTKWLQARTRVHHNLFLAGYPEAARRVWMASKAFATFKPKKITPVPRPPPVDPSLDAMLNLEATRLSKDAEMVLRQEAARTNLA